MATVRKTGIGDEFRIFEADVDYDEDNNWTSTDGENITSELGKIEVAGFALLEEDGNEHGSVGKAPELQEAIEGVVGTELTLTVKAPSFVVMQLMGEKIEEDGDWQEVNLTDYLPEFNVEMVVTNRGAGDNFNVQEPKTLRMERVKWEQAQIDISNDGIATVQFEGKAIKPEVKNETFETPDPEGVTSNYLDLVAYLDDRPVGALQNGTITYNRECSFERDIEQTQTGMRRLPTEIVESSEKEFNWDATVKVTDDAPLRAFMEGSVDESDLDNYPITVSDRKETVPFKVAHDNEGDQDPAGGSVELEGGHVRDTDGELNDNAEVRTFDIGGSGLVASIEA